MCQWWPSTAPPGVSTSGTVRVGMVICSVLAVGMCVVRAFEFGALHVRWDTNAYGSA